MNIRLNYLKLKKPKAYGFRQSNEFLPYKVCYRDRFGILKISIDNAKTQEDALNCVKFKNYGLRKSKYFAMEAREALLGGQIDKNLKININGV